MDPSRKASHLLPSGKTKIFGIKSEILIKDKRIKWTLALRLRSYSQRDKFIRINNLEPLPFLYLTNHTKWSRMSNLFIIKEYHTWRKNIWNIRSTWICRISIRSLGFPSQKNSRDTSPVMRLKLNPQTAQPHPYLEAFHCESATLRCHSDYHSWALYVLEVDRYQSSLN